MRIPALALGCLTGNSDARGPELVTSLSDLLPRNRSRPVVDNLHHLLSRVGFAVEIGALLVETITFLAYRWKLLPSPGTLGAGGRPLCAGT